MLGMTWSRRAERGQSEVGLMRCIAISCLLWNKKKHNSKCCCRQQARPETDTFLVLLLLYVCDSRAWTHNVCWSIHVCPCHSHQHVLYETSWGNFFIFATNVDELIRNWCCNVTVTFKKIKHYDFCDPWTVPLVLPGFLDNDFSDFCDPLLPPLVWHLCLNISDRFAIDMYVPGWIIITVISHSTF